MTYWTCSFVNITKLLCDLSKIYTHFVFLNIKKRYFSKKKHLSLQKIDEICKICLKNHWKNGCIPWSLLTFLTKKVIFSSKCACISSTIFTFLPNNPVCFNTKNSQKVDLFWNCAYNKGHFFNFFPKKRKIYTKHH